MTKYEEIAKEYNLYPQEVQALCEMVGDEEAMLRLRIRAYHIIPKLKGFNITESVGVYMIEENHPYFDSDYPELTEFIDYHAYGEHILENCRSHRILADLKEIVLITDDGE